MRDTRCPGMAFLIAMAGLLIGVGILNCAGIPLAPTSPPNVILIFVDTLRADHLGAYGYERDTSPALDRLASESLVFRNAIAQAPWTAPSVATALTSRFPYELGYQDSRPPVVLADRFLLLPEIFSANGYRTAGIVSHHFVSRKLGFSQGFDFFDQENAKGHQHISSPSITNKAIDYLDEKRNGDPPFFLFLHYFDPHYAYRLHEGYDFDPDYEGEVVTGMEQPALNQRGPWYDDADRNYIRSLYDSEIRFTDEHIGRLFDALRSRTLYKNTLIVVAGDHGEEFGTRPEPHFGHSSTLFQELIHVPLIIKLPGRSHSQDIETAVGLIDLTPSLVAALSLEVPEEHRFDGRTLPLLEAKKLAELPEVPIFSETRLWGLFLQSVTFAGRKLISDKRSGEFFFFHLTTDPGEETDLSYWRRQIVKTYLEKLAFWASYVSERREGNDPPTADFSDEELQQLRALGYLN